MQSVITSERADDRFTESLLKTMPNFPLDAMRHLEAASINRKYDRGNMLIKEGQLSGGIFLLLTGSVQRWMSVPSWTSRKRNNLTAMSAPAVLGTISCMLREPSILNISASMPAEAAFIPQADLFDVLYQYPQAGLAMSQLVSGELADTYVHLTELRSGSIPGQPSPLLN